MSKSKQPETKSFEKEIDSLLALLESRKVAAMATLNEEQRPEASLTPFIFYQNCFWVFVSRLSSHTTNLLKRPHASLMISVEESSASNPFAVQRASIQCEAQEDQGSGEEVLKKMRLKLGETVSLLQQLPDFYLIRLTPVSGRYIIGFGQAFEIDFENIQLKHINPSQS
jgi:putative heme iron utilization protein